jgi:hypothetical protein
MEISNESNHQIYSPQLFVTPNHLYSVYTALQLFDLGRFFSFLIYTQLVGLPGRGISRSQSLYLHRGQHKQNTHIHTSMSRVKFEPTTPVFERAKAVHALDRAATVIGNPLYAWQYYGKCTNCESPFSHSSRGPCYFVVLISELSPNDRILECSNWLFCP